ncbi:hydrogenase 4 subunit B [Metallibacterium sp.]|uniref:hydrogenase 4 subunit B n=1 Tax=Metallibacterium sp. TaxID=2940281 RepID=UPI0026175EC2|nr:hydrogenase 4 subunit B [Metallibacterium sp.]
MMLDALALPLAGVAVLAALASAAVSPAAARWPRVLSWLSFPLLGVCALAALGAGIDALWFGGMHHALLPLGLPWLPWQVQVDPLAGVFLLILGAVLLAVAVYGPGYAREFRNGRDSLAALGVFTALFVVGMLGVLLAADAFLFMVAWELMSLASYFLVAFQHEQAEHRHAAFLYLLLAHVAGLAILLAFGVLAAASGSFSFAVMRAAHPDALWAAVAFALALIGFGTKAGLAPLHVWLPEAHPAAPSHISALMSAVMLKVALYGFLRVVFDLLGPPQWGFGVTLVLVGGATAVLGVLFALQQTDLKRLLAYSSIENLGIIFLALGLAQIFQAAGHPALAALALVAALYQALNHALLKGLLFLGAGAVLHGAHERSLDHLGGLLRRMPRTGWFFLIGCLGMAAVPPLNGFVSEWLTFQAALQAWQLHDSLLRILVPLAAAALALTAALGAAVFVRAFGTAFLGRARSRQARRAHEVGRGMLAGQALLILGIAITALLPGPVLGLLARAATQLTGATVAGDGWLWLTPISPSAASYSPLPILAVLLIVGALGVALLRPRRRAAVRRTVPWDCGFAPPTPRMQYSAAGFAQPQRRVFAPLYALHEQVTPGRYELAVGDRAWRRLYLPLGALTERAADLARRMQAGHVRRYLAWSLITLLVLLWIVS